jgi:hypothetical protein
MKYADRGSQEPQCRIRFGSRSHRRTRLAIRNERALRPHTPPSARRKEQPARSLGAASIQVIGPRLARRLMKWTPRRCAKRWRRRLL